MSVLYADRVAEVLEYVADHPMDVMGERMSYDPWHKLDPDRLPDVVEGLGREDVILQHDLNNNNSSSSINRPKLGKREEHLCDVTLGMLYLACGGLDEAHDLALPHSWPTATPVGGPPVEDTQAATEASYLHAIVHRKEGQWVGPDRSGWSGACNWFRITGYHPLFPRVRLAALEIAKSYGEATRSRVISEIGSEWDPDVFTRLCREAVTEGEGDLFNFCGDVVNAEWRMLLDECNKIINRL